MIKPNEHMQKVLKKYEEQGMERTPRDFPIPKKRKIMA